MRALKAFVLAMVAGLTCWVYAQTGAPQAAAGQAKPMVVPDQRVEINTDVDNDKGQLIVKDMTHLEDQFQILQRDFADAQNKMKADYKASQDKLEAWIASTKKAQGWGDDVIYDGKANKWYRVKKAEAKPGGKKAQ